MRRLKSNAVLPLFAALPFVVSLASATPLSNSFPTPRADTPALDGHCRTVADNDLYGKGVRIGMYLQWAAGFLIRNFESWGMQSRVRTTSNVLASAVALATVINICQGTALSTDYLLSYYLTVVLFYAESYNLDIRVEKYFEKKRILRRSIFRYEGILVNSGTAETLELHADLPLVFQNVYFTAFTLFGAWYWLKGVHSTADPVCGGKAALLGVFDIRSRTWTHAAAALAIIAGVAFLMVFFIHLTSLYDGIESGPKLVAVTYAAAMLPVSASRTYANAPSKQERKLELKLILKALLKPAFPGVASLSADELLQFLLGLIHYFIIYLAGPLVAIVSVERMLAANHLVTASAFGSTGQIIALFTGITSLLLACWEIVKSRWKPGNTDHDTHSTNTKQVTTLGSAAQSKSSSGKDAPVEEKPSRVLGANKKGLLDDAQQEHVHDEDEIKEAK